jgi:predicted PhzF superfamily epimerase YddE/YHI9
MTTLHVLRVFCADDGTGGNQLGVFMDGADVPRSERQAIAHELGFAETVFVDDRGHGEIRIFTPEVEFPFAGHPVVGTAWLLREEGTPPSVLRPPAGECAVSFERELAFVAGRPEWGPEFEFVPVESREEVDALAGPPQEDRSVAVWVWTDENAGWIRARVFLPDAGIPEDPATGSAAMRLCAQLGRPIEIRQGPTAGSLILARPHADGEGTVEVGGRVALDEVREYAA